jgi:hypothetical protein
VARPPLAGRRGCSPTLWGWSATWACWRCRPGWAPRRICAGWPPWSGSSPLACRGCSPARARSNPGAAPTPPPGPRFAPAASARTGQGPGDRGGR